MVVDGAKRVGMRSPPDAVLYNSNGILNAFARQIFGRKYLLLTSALVDVTTDEQVNFIIGHELAHHAAGHLNSVGFWLRFPARIIPFLHSAYFRQCEYTCDKIGYYISRDSNHACAALQMLGCGCQRLNGKMNIFAFEKQELQVPPISGFFSEIIRIHPRLTRRITSLKNSRLMD
jgi:Zn-dependent protease with chaperone function